MKNLQAKIENGKMTVKLPKPGDKERTREYMQGLRALCEAKNFDSNYQTGRFNFDSVFTYDLKQVVADYASHGIKIEVVA